jgi:hypothetical protein
MLIISSEQKAGTKRSIEVFKNAVCSISRLMKNTSLKFK